MLHRTCLLCGCICAVVFTSFFQDTEVIATVQYRTVALSGEIAPGTGGGALFDSFSSVIINESGQAAILGRIFGAQVDTTNNEGIWTEGGGPLDIVARAGDLAPNTESDTRFDNFVVPTMFSNTGKIAFTARLNGPNIDTNREGIWSETDGGLKIIARLGESAPGTAAGVEFIGNIGIHGVADNGDVLVGGELSGPGVNASNNRGFWSSGPHGPLELFLRRGDPAPGQDPGVTFRTIYSPRVSANGTLAFSALMAGVPLDTRSSFWLGSPESISLIVREGDQAPGTDPGVLFDTFSFTPPAINNAGQVSFQSNLTGAGVDSTNSRGIWSNGSGSLELIARAGDTPPGTDPSVEFLGFNSPKINQSGETAFRSSISGTGLGFTSEEGYWAEQGGELNLIVRTGDAAPDPVPGTYFNALRSLTPFFNSNGQMAFEAMVAVGGQANQSRIGIWAADTNGELVYIARRGELFDVNDDPLVEDLRTITSVRVSGLNDAGQLALNLEFGSSSGVFVVTIPEPGSLALLGLGSVLTIRQRR